MTTGAPPEQEVARSVERACPICGKPAIPEHRPFCSRRCADVDLHRWFSGAYAIAGAPAADERRDEEE
jgi:endogenous inhibitor of DNA gyrase (YacG/DUF329 family)